MPLEQDFDTVRSTPSSDSSRPGFPQARKKYLRSWRREQVFLITALVGGLLEW